MSNDMNKTVREFYKAVEGVKNKKPLGYDTQATVRRIEDGVAWVHIPDGVDETPARMTISAKEGDVVQVRIVNGRAFLVGNASAPPTDNTEAVKAMGQAGLAAEAASIARQKADEAVEDAATAHEAAMSAQDSADIAQEAAENAQRDADDVAANLKSVVAGATTVEKAVSVMQTALEAVVDYDPTTDTTKEYFWHDANGAHVLGADSGYRNDVDSSGMKIVEVNTEDTVAEFGASGAQIGKDDEIHLDMSDKAFTMYDGIGNSFFDVNIEGSQVTKGYNKSLCYMSETSTFSEQTELPTYISPLSSLTPFTTALRWDRVAVFFMPESGVTPSAVYPQYSSGATMFTRGTAATSKYMIQQFVGTADYIFYFTFNYDGATNVTLTVSCIKYSDSSPVHSITGLNSVHVYMTDAQYRKDFINPAYTIGRRTNLGGYNTAGAYSAAIGEELVAKDDNQVVIGKYNSNQSTNAFEVGNGTSDSARSNAMTVDWSGNILAASAIRFKTGTVTLPSGTGRQTNTTISISDIVPSGYTAYSAIIRLNTYPLPYVATSGMTWLAVLDNTHIEIANTTTAWNNYTYYITLFCRKN